ncbi:hypothetical protein LCGC14_1988020 [marine sediment metagenome]|uniref:DUF1937 domain-containing protein n=1 Tax=marine sediment metagenome TaxID=412755 RepID=A0A0F9FUY3_9ZZZZ
MKTYIYLASPYTALRADGSLDDVLMAERHRAVSECFTNLVKAGLVVYCPITMTHPVDVISGGLGAPFWYEFGKPFLQHMAMLFILKLPGWEKSEGLEEEIKVAIARKVPIVYLEFAPTSEYRLET